MIIEIGVIKCKENEPIKTNKFIHDTEKYKQLKCVPEDKLIVSRI